MFSIKIPENRTSLPMEGGKRMKFEVRTYGNKRGDRSKSRRKTSSDTPTSPTKREKHTGPPVLILDNGAHSAKIGMSTNAKPSVVPNCIMKVKSERKRFFIGNQIDECRDLSGLYYLLPCEKGYIMKWTVQKPVWDYLFNNLYPVDDKPVILTQPMFNFKSIQEITDEIFFEEYEIKSLFRVNPTDLAKYQYVNKVTKRITPCIVIDCGYSFTNIVPYISGKKYYKAVTRINLGGKLLTNHLKDIISYRQLHVMDETYVINQVKEDTCYVSSNFNQDMKTARLHNNNTIVRNYVLPDFNNIRRGYIQEDNNIPEGCQILRLNNERFTVPEILFHPSDIGMDSMGVAEAVVNSILLCPVKDQPSLAKNIILMGGNVNFPGFKERILNDVRSHLPDHWTVNVFKPENPVTFAWEGGKSLVDDPKCKSLLITKEQYEEQGSSYTYEHFSDWIHTQTSLDEETNKSGEIHQPTGILQTSNFTRFDLFGKYEPENDEIITLEDEATEIDPSVNETTKNDNSNTTDSSKDIDVDTANSRRDSSIETSTAENEDANKSSSKNLKIVVDVEENSEDVEESSFLNSYDFNVLNSSYV